MKRQDIAIGKHYTAKVSGKLTVVRVDAIRETNSYRAHQPYTPTTRYDVTNVATGRSTTFRSAQRFKTEATPAQVAAAKSIRSKPAQTPADPNQCERCNGTGRISALDICSNCQGSGLRNMVSSAS